MRDRDFIISILVIGVICLTVPYLVVSFKYPDLTSTQVLLKTYPTILVSLPIFAIGIYHLAKDETRNL